MELSALLLNCTLKPSPGGSSTDAMLGLVAEKLAVHDVVSETVRVVDLDVRPGVGHDEGDGDDWPAIEAKVLEADILVLGTPVWLGSPSSVCKRVAERLEAATLEVGDFADCLDRVDEGDLVFLDPPYTVAHNNNVGTISYRKMREPTDAG